MTGRQVRVLLSGGIGSGKSTVGDLLARKGACVFNADCLGHKVLAADGEAHGAVAAGWPEAVVDGMIDRARLAQIVFSDTSELRRLEDITHPAIRRRLERLVDECDANVVVVEVPLLADLLGPGWTRLVVDAPKGVRQRRLRALGMTDDDIDRRMEAQPSRREWLAAADLVIDNSGSREELVAGVEELWINLQDVSDP